MNQNLHNDWLEFKKEVTWNNVKIIISAGLPLSLYFYGWTFWVKFVSPFMEEYSKSTSIHDTTIALLASIAFVAPLALAMPIVSLGLWIGKATKFYIDNKNRTVWWDDITYFVRDMPEEERKRIADILSPYKSKLQLRKEAKSKQSWLRRNFT